MDTGKKARALVWTSYPPRNVDGHELAVIFGPKERLHLIGEHLRTNLREFFRATARVVNWYGIIPTG